MRKVLLYGLLLVFLSVPLSSYALSDSEVVGAMGEVYQALKTTLTELQTVSTELQAARNEQAIITQTLLTLRDEQMPQLDQRLTDLERYYTNEIRRVRFQAYLVGGVCLVLSALALVL